MLQSTVEYGTLYWRSVLVGGFDVMPMAGKTGTTDNWSDAWTVGFSPYMTTAVWLGFDMGGNNSLGTNQTGAQTAGPIWAAYMKEVHATLPKLEFERPLGLVDVTITSDSGLLPTEDYRGATLEEIFIPGTEPTEFDTLEDFHDERSARVAAQRTRTSAGRNSVADRLRDLGLLDVSDRSSPSTTGSTTFEGSGNPFLDDESEPAENPAEEPTDGLATENQSRDQDGTEEEEGPNPILD
jgi:penicillin-binding protein 1A